MRVSSRAIAGGASLQEDALKRAGCEKVFVDRVNGTVAERLGLAKVKELLRKGDTLIVWRLDRLGRSLKDLIEWVTYLGCVPLDLRRSGRLCG
jgi:DNA invertase Pin-like site-specific DNA recombinase